MRIAIPTITYTNSSRIVPNCTDGPATKRSCPFCSVHPGSTSFTSSSVSNNIGDESFDAYIVVVVARLLDLALLIVALVVLVVDVVAVCLATWRSDAKATWSSRLSLDLGLVKTIHSRDQLGVNPGTCCKRLGQKDARRNKNVFRRCAFVHQSLQPIQRDPNVCEHVRPVVERVTNGYNRS